MHRLNLPQVFLLLTGLFISPLTGNSAVLARYEFTGNSDASTDDDVVNATSTATNFSVGPGIPGASFTASGNPGPARTMAVADTALNEGASVTANDYFEFTVTPEPGYELDLTSMSLEFDASFNTQPRGYSIRSSLNNYADTIFDYNEPIGGTVGSFEFRSYDLSDPLYQNITTSVTFRIYGFDNASASGNNLRFDNVTLNGVVPEPSRSLLLFAGLGLLVGRRRR